MDLYRLTVTTTTLDADGGLGPGIYAGTPDVANIPCQVAPDYATVEELDQGRITTVREYTILIAAPSAPAMKARDKLVWTDNGNLALFIEGPIDAAGRHRLIEVTARERV